MTDVAQNPVITVHPIVVPATLDAPDAGPFLELVRIANAVCLHDAGHDYLHEEPDEGKVACAGHPAGLAGGLQANRQPGHESNRCPGVVQGVHQYSIPRLAMIPRS